jgi:ATP-dependent helicase/nuclease subunit A
MSGIVHPLHGEQREAVNPRDTVWLSASAGTGKTQVLSARVLRLLLQPEVEPGQILCLTFTKAGAAEMAVRVNDVLARWVRMKDGPLAEDLKNIGADIGPETLARARTLFASVLDCPGGGLRIDTIHAFAQWLLSAFPEEAGLAPGTSAMEDREREMLLRDVLGEMLREAGKATLDTVGDLSLRKGPEAVEAWLMRCASAYDLWFGPGAWQPPMRERVNALLGLAADASEADAAALCADDAFDVASLRTCHSSYNQWNGKKGQAGRVVIGDWLAADPAQRLAMLPELHAVLFTQKDTVRDVASLEKFESEFGSAAERVLESSLKVREFRALLDLAQWLAPLLELGRQFALRWEQAKAREGLIDFDDQIRKACELLTRTDLSAWIRYKLDRRFDHILVDEAQDTNWDQWRIILDGLADEFFSGEGQHADRLRTLFVVGDYKQAIFRFQGTSPENFRRAKQRVQSAIEDARANAEQLRRNTMVSRFQELGLDRSFRSAQQVLDFVDAAIGAIGHGRFGLDKAPDEHKGDVRPGLVALWPPVSSETAESADIEYGDEDDAAGEGKETWLQRSDRVLADRIAQQVHAWLRDGFPLVKGAPRNAGPGDVMVLVRKRKELASLIVARLYARGVLVAGVDRLRLGGPLAVRDLMAALRFAAQPLDCLNLANLLVSPLIGWSQEELLQFAWRPEGLKLWEHLRQSGEPKVRETLGLLGDLLALADYEPPQALLHWLLVGPWNGRHKLIARLGREANDPIDELLNAALAYASAHTPSLQGFIQWFDVGEGELKREAGASFGQVRVMTVHGAKGLQSPIVILADAAGNPDDSPVRDLELEEEPVGGGEGRKVPLPGLTKDEKVGRIREAEQQAAVEEREEHWRLLYVAMTRAEEALFIGGSLNLREKDGPKEDSWFARLKPLFPQDGIDDPIWGERWELGGRAAPVAEKAAEATKEPPLPAWATTPVGPEPRPPRPLSPSSAGEDLSPDPPTPPGVANEAARRGTLIHKLLERLPELPPEARREAALRWLERQAGDLDEDKRAELADSALAVLDTPDWAEIFGPGALAEVPLAATVAGQVIAGTADRLLVTPERVLVVDFKTALRPPSSLGEVPLSTLRQMAAYAAALGAIFPGRKVQAALLYTHTPQLIALPRDLVDKHKPVLSVTE